MGAEQIQDTEITTLNIEIKGKTDNGSRMLKIPEAKLSQYIKLVKDRLTNGFWNEVVGEQQIIFVFKFSDGSTKEYKLSLENEREIDTLCAQFNNESSDKTANVYKYISENDFYHDFMMKHYEAFINR